MKISFLPFVFASATLPAVFAHTLFTTLFINDANQDDATCVRMPMTPGNATNQVIGMQDVSMACGNGPNNFTALACHADSGSKLSFLFRVTPDGSVQEGLDSSHKGPCAVYMKNVASPFSSAPGGSWFKIWDEGYDKATSSWCSSRLMQNNGMISVNIPDSLAGGYYLVRTEILTLHEADKNPPNPQFYVGCAQIFLGPAKTGNGVVPKATIEIPGHVKAGDPAVNFNIYEPVWPYPMSGPPPYTPGDPSVPVAQVKSQNIGVLPKGVSVKNANWWATPLESYTTSDGCWNVSESCFNQLTNCYNSAPPTGSEGCRRFEQYCTEIQQDCRHDTVSGLPQIVPAPTPLMSYNVPASAKQLQGQQYDAKYQGSNYKYLKQGSQDNKGESTHAPSALSIDDIQTHTSQSIQSTAPSSTKVTSSISTTATGLPSSKPPISISTDGSCGLDAMTGLGNTCRGSAFGDCCNEHGKCGKGKDYCFGGCQIGPYGHCGVGVMERSAGEKKINGWHLNFLRRGRRHGGGGLR